MQRNLTTGSVLKNVLLFSLPYLLSYFLQTLYGMADLFIIGQFEGVASTTAVSIGSQVMHMITVILVGLAMGTTVSIAQAVGADNNKEAAKSVGNTVTLFMIVSIGLMAVLLLFVNPIVSIISTPEEAVQGTALYPILQSASLVSHSLPPITSSVQSSAVWVTVRARCSLLPSPV